MGSIIHSLGKIIIMEIQGPVRHENLHQNLNRANSQREIV